MIFHHLTVPAGVTARIVTLTATLRRHLIRPALTWAAGSRDVTATRWAVTDSRLMSSLPECLSAGPLELRRWSIEHLDDVMVAVEASYPELHLWMEWAQSLPARASIGGYLDYCVAAFDADEDWQYCLVERGGGAVVGGAGLHRRGGPDVLEIGYWVRTDRCGRGYATASARALTTAAFRAPLGVESVRICMDRMNLPSAAVPRRLGFVLAAEIEREVVTPGHTGTGLVWTVRRSDWPDARDASTPPARG